MYSCTISHHVWVTDLLASSWLTGWLAGWLAKIPVQPYMRNELNKICVMKMLVSICKWIGWLLWSGLVGSSHHHHPPTIHPSTIASSISYLSTGLHNITRHRYRYIHPSRASAAAAAELYRIISFGSNQPIADLPDIAPN